MELTSTSAMIESVEQYLLSSLRTPIVQFFTTTLILVIILLLRTHYYHGLNKIPGPFLASVTCLWKWNVVRQEKMPFVNTELHEKYGPLVRIGPNHVSASSAESIHVVHRAKNGFTKVLIIIYTISQL